MNYVHPIAKPLNNHEIVKWKNDNYEHRVKYENFVKEMRNMFKDKNITDKEIDDKWKYNFGDVPPGRPEPIYSCNIVNSDIKLNVIVSRNKDYNNSNREYKVIRLNKLILNNYDYKRIMTTVDSQLKFKISYKSLISENNLTESNILYIDKEDMTIKTTINMLCVDDEMLFLKPKDEHFEDNNLIIEYSLDNLPMFEQRNISIENKTDSVLTSSNVDIKSNNDTNFNQEEEEVIDNNDMLLYYLELYENHNLNESFCINYEDSEWFSLLHIQDMLSKLCLRISPYEIGSNIKEQIAKCFIFNMDHLEIVDFEFKDIVFKEHLYNMIDQRFKELKL